MRGQVQVRLVPPSDAERAATALADIRRQLAEVGAALATVAAQVAPSPSIDDDETLTRLEREFRARQAHLAGITEAGWLVLLGVARAERAGKRVSVSGACYAADPHPPTTALRHIGGLLAAGLLERTPARDDQRRRWLGLSENGRARMTAYLAAVEARPRPTGRLAVLPA